MSHGCVSGPTALATDGLSLVATAGFSVPAALLVAGVVAAMVRDRRLAARERETPDGAHGRPEPLSPPRAPGAPPRPPR
ncbi:hypothetical protein SAMN05444351_1041 [Geodermatophilus nigrescens]|uniref:Uncharacterized protein n=1 Tax=Geodermatophilus nigrescens TaxID=1070870 RepID=A0A1M5F274_9ACTN|nr:hypothetical protein SAMN05444351_1041 [Geodermatophilus nigrescens]